MNIDYSWQQGELEILMAIGLTTLGFITYWFISLSEAVKRTIKKKYSTEKTLIIWVLFQKQIGVLFLGIIPAICCFTFIGHSWSFYGVSLQNFGLSMLYFLGLSLVLVPLTLYSARKPDTIATYPQIRVLNWTPKLVAINSLNWVLYLLAYEFLFRGILLLVLVPILGVWTAIIVNVSIYSITHIPKGVKETISAIPFGFVLCLITLDTGTIWVAFLAHVVLALTNDFGALYFNPKMQIVAK